MTYLKPRDPDGLTFREEIALTRTTDLSGMQLPSSNRVDDRTAEQLVNAVTRHAARATTPTISDSERLARAAAAGDAARDLEEVAATLDPYRGQGHSRIRDLLVLSGAHGVRGDTEAAAERLALARQADYLQRAWADLTGAPPGVVADASAATVTINPCQWLNSAYVTQPTGEIGRGRLIADGWSSIPAAHLDPDMGDDVSAGTQATMDGEDVPWHLSAISFNTSLQRIDWAVDDGTETEQLMSSSVDITLEEALLADLAAGAPAAASFEAAEAAVGAVWAPGANLIVCAGVDRPAVVRAYAAEQIPAEDRPIILSTAGATPGTALVMASRAVRVEATRMEWLVAVEPRLIGRSVAALRYGLARARVPGAVQTVTIGA